MKPHLIRRTVLVVGALGGACLLLRAQTAPTTPLRARLMWMEADDYYQARGELAHARQVLENVREYLRTQGKAEAVEFINPTGRLAKLSSRLGDFDRATALYDETSVLVARRFGAESIENARVKNQQATMLYFAKRYADAVAKGREGLAIAEKVRGPDDIEVANAAAVTATALQEQKQFEAAEAMLERAVAIYAKKRGADDEYTRSERFNLAQVYLAHGRLDKARDAFESSKAGTLVGSRSSLGDMDLYRGLVVLAISEHDPARAGEYADQLFAAQLHLVHDVFPGMTEEDRLKAKGQLDLMNWCCSIGDAERIAKSVLQTKAITLDTPSVVQLTRATDPFARLLTPENAAEAFQPISAELFSELQSMRKPRTEVAPAAKSSPGGLESLYSLTAAQVTAALPRDTAVVEFVRYEHQLGCFQFEPRYGALVFQSRDAPANPSAGPSLIWVPLGPSAPIDTEIAALLKTVRDPLAAARVGGNLRTLYKAVWAPIAAQLRPAAEKIFICPDAQLCFLPYAALLGPDDKFLGEKQAVMYLSTARDLFQNTPTNPGAGRGEFAIFAAPDFGNSSVNTSRLAGGPVFRDVEAQSLAELHLVDLPGALAEAKSLAGVARRYRLDPRLFTRGDATETAVRGLRSPRIIHFATHGFVLPLATGVVPPDPMDRSGLALAGAQRTLTEFGQGKSSIPRDADGLLMAREVMSLPLHGTWLVTLAACDTGQGEARDGESVLGLRRGFLAAGVQNLMLSLWILPDSGTADFMRDFYERALDTSDPAMALALTQRQWLVRLRRKQGIAAAFILAGPFVLNCSGRLPAPKVP